jgi:hypothetical protein
MDLRQPGTFIDSINIDDSDGLDVFDAGMPFFLPHPVELNKSIQITNKIGQFNTNSDVKRAYFLSLFPLISPCLCSL